MDSQKPASNADVSYALFLAALLPHKSFFFPQCSSVLLPLGRLERLPLHHVKRAGQVSDLPITDTQQEQASAEERRCWHSNNAEFIVSISGRDRQL